MMPGEVDFVNHMRRLNIRLTDRVVCYETGDWQIFSFRVVWMLRAMGHTNAQILDGGYPKWVKEGKPIVTDDTIKDEDYNYKMNPEFVKSFEWVKQYEANQGANELLVDARREEGFKAGHIKNAVSFPFSKVIDPETKTVKSAEERKAAFAEAGIDLNKDITTTCQAGIVSTVVFLALHDIAQGKLSMYDGSWTEYAQRSKEES
uniref:Rhodanese domain-containing protein n=1 Tax=Strombidium inclinatum TaxID=197538 RepID=A0A7S3IVI9_9SPIT|mmetsp:Transcript_4591/g.6977  ORF Transcript_4591/g.6977 Transcript_4591/m.6977 type:complete len:204 (+) Transcript_4591:204-815(+)